MKVCIQKMSALCILTLVVSIFNTEKCTGGAEDFTDMNVLSGGIT